jgi:hypothetical protein
MPATQAILRVQEVPGYAQAHPKQANDKALLIDWDGKPVALLYVTPATYTIAWEGVVAFERLEDEVAGALEALGWVGVRLREDAWRGRISAALVIPGPDDSDELVKCRLGVAEEYTRYSNLMDHPLAISFARYDVFDNVAAQSFFSFIAENAALRQGLESEVALKLSKSQKWTEGLLRWVLAHHRLGNLLIQEIARAPSVSVLNQHLASR